MMIMTVDQSGLIDAKTLLAALSREFSSIHLELHAVSKPSIEFQIPIREPKQPEFRVALHKNGFVDSDGTSEQNARVASAVRAALPHGGARIVAVSDSSEFVDLTTGITPAEIAAGWQPLSEGSFG